MVNNSATVTFSEELGGELRISLHMDDKDDYSVELSVRLTPVFYHFLSFFYSDLIWRIYHGNF